MVSMYRGPQLFDGPDAKVNKQLVVHRLLIGAPLFAYWCSNVCLLVFPGAGDEVGNFL